MGKFELLVLSKAELSAPVWVTNVPPQVVTGAVTRVSVTNEARQGYFRVVAKPVGE